MSGRPVRRTRLGLQGPGVRQARPGPEACDMGSAGGGARGGGGGAQLGLAEWPRPAAPPPCPPELLGCCLCPSPAPLGCLLGCHLEARAWALPPGTGGQQFGLGLALCPLAGGAWEPSHRSPATAPRRRLLLQTPCPQGCGTRSLGRGAAGQPAAFALGWGRGLACASGRGGRALGLRRFPVSSRACSWEAAAGPEGPAVSVLLYSRDLWGLGVQGGPLPLLDGNQG